MHNHHAHASWCPMYFSFTYQAKGHKYQPEHTVVFWDDLHDPDEFAQMSHMNRSAPDSWYPLLSPHEFTWCYFKNPAFFYYLSAIHIPQTGLGHAIITAFFVLCQFLIIKPTTTEGTIIEESVHQGLLDETLKYYQHVTYNPTEAPVYSAPNKTRFTAKTKFIIHGKLQKQNTRNLLACHKPTKSQH